MISLDPKQWWGNYCKSLVVGADRDTRTRQLVAALSGLFCDPVYPHEHGDTQAFGVPV